MVRNVIIIRKIIIIALYSLNIGNALATIGKNNIYRNFWLPMYHGERLNYCSLDQQKCGLPIATHYCRMMGYNNAIQQVKDYNIGLSNFISSRAQCLGWQCNSFKTIKCVKQLENKLHSYNYSLQQFVCPRFNNYRISWCYDDEHHCGRRVAFSFCRRMGYLKPHKYAIQQHVRVTKAIGNQKLCLGPSCKGFAYIICAR